jgi:hypothetical protein
MVSAFSPILGTAARRGAAKLLLCGDSMWCAARQKTLSGATPRVFVQCSGHRCRGTIRLDAAAARLRRPLLLGI